MAAHIPFFSTILFSDMNFFPQKLSEDLHSIFDDIGKGVQVHPLHLDHYLYEKICARTDQIVDLDSRLCDIDGSHCCVLGELFRNYNYKYTRTMKTVYAFSAINQEGTSYRITVQNVGIMRLQKDGYCMLMLDGRHLHRSTEISRYENGVE